MFTVCAVRIRQAFDACVRDRFGKIWIMFLSGLAKTVFALGTVFICRAFLASVVYACGTSVLFLARFNCACRNTGTVRAFIPPTVVILSTRVPASVIAADMVFLAMAVFRAFNGITGAVVTGGFVAAIRVRFADDALTVFHVALVTGITVGCGVARGRIFADAEENGCAAVACDSFCREHFGVAFQIV